MKKLCESEALNGLSEALKLSTKLICEQKRKCTIITAFALVNIFHTLVRLSGGYKVQLVEISWFTIISHSNFL